MLEKIRGDKLKKAINISMEEKQILKMKLHAKKNKTSVSKIIGECVRIVLLKAEFDNE